MNTFKLHVFPVYKKCINKTPPNYFGMENIYNLAWLIRQWEECHILTMCVCTRCCFSGCGKKTAAMMETHNMVNNTEM